MLTYFEDVVKFLSQERKGRQYQKKLYNIHAGLFRSAADFDSKVNFPE